MFCSKKKNSLYGCLVLLLEVAVATVSAAAPPSKTVTNAARYGLEVKRHHVITHDGYRLALYRIRPHHHTPRGIVLLQHGIRQSSADWLMINRNLPMQLLEAGLEVWLGNSRASPETVHNKHMRNSTEYWNFSFNEIGYFDLPAMIDTVLTASRRSQLHLVGFSEGSTASLILLSEQVSYNAKVASLNVIAPATFMINSFIKEFSYIYETFRDSFPSLQEIITGSEKPVINSDKQLQHFHQLLVTGRFRHFDYGEWDNVKHYGVERPPPYALWRITAPVTVHYGTADGIVPPEDVRNLAMQLHKSKKVRIVQHDRFDHRDFMMQPDAAVRVYPRVVYAIMELMQ